jgi:N-terminal half of MaoC dehydratase
MAENQRTLASAYASAYGAPRDGVLEVRSGVVVRRAFQDWAAAVGDLNPLYFDEGYARSAGHRDVVMPPMFLSQVTVQTRFLHELRPDGIPFSNSFGLPLPERRMAAEEETEFWMTLYPDDYVSATRRLVGVQRKQGRSGEFSLVTIQVDYADAGSRPIARTTAAIIAR